MNWLVVALAVLSIWEYPAKQLEHTKLKAAFVNAYRTGDTSTMLETSSKAAALLPEDPTWAYNYACALAYKEDQEPAYVQLEKAIDLGYRDHVSMAADLDLARLKDRKRFAKLIEYARSIAKKPILFGPLASVPTTCGVGNGPLSVGEHNLGWDFEVGAFSVKAKLTGGKAGANRYDLYMNRDGMHSRINVADFPGLTEVMLDREARNRRAHLDFPNMIFPYPVFGNCSRALQDKSFWRSLPRALMTIDRNKFYLMEKFYFLNQIWVFPANADYPPVGVNGDLFMSVAPYWIVTSGASWSDLYYLKASLEISRSLKSEVKAAAVSKGMLAPLVQNIIRRSVVGVETEADYLSSKAHPTCMPPNGLNVPKLIKLSKKLKAEEIPPVAIIAAGPAKPKEGEKIKAECVFSSRCSVAFVVREDKGTQEFFIKSTGGTSNEFSIVNGVSSHKLERIASNLAKLTIDLSSITSRVDVAIFAKSDSSTWGAPSFVTVANPTKTKGYVDPFFAPNKK